MISRLRREMQIARLPWQTASSASISTLRMPWFARPSATARPTGAADDRYAMPVRIDTVVARRQMRGMALGDERVGLEVDIHWWLPGRARAPGATRAGSRSSMEAGGSPLSPFRYSKPTGIYPDSVIAGRFGSGLQAECEQLALARDAQAPVCAFLVRDDARRLHADRLPISCAVWPSSTPRSTSSSRLDSAGQALRSRASIRCGIPICAAPASA